jgi:voltage-gated potassium channel
MTAQTASLEATGAQPDVAQSESSMYELFTGLLTILSLGVMFFTVIVRIPEVDQVLVAIDTLFCVIFLFDFGRSLVRAESKRDYMLGPRPGRTLPQGTFDLLGSIPAAGAFRAFRVFRLTRVVRILRLRQPRELAREFVDRRADAAAYLIVIGAILVLLLGGCAIAFVEPSAEGSNIKSGSDAIWWAFVTITTVGYGDRFPVTNEGRIIGVLTMATGIAIFGVLTSYLATIFMGSSAEERAAEDKAAKDAADAEAATDRALAAEVAAVRSELAELRRLLEARPGGAAG